MSAASDGDFQFPSSVNRSARTPSPFQPESTISTSPTQSNDSALKLTLLALKQLKSLMKQRTTSGTIRKQETKIAHKILDFITADEKGNSGEQ